MQRKGLLQLGFNWCTTDNHNVCSIDIPILWPFSIHSTAQQHTQIWAHVSKDRTYLETWIENIYLRILNSYTKISFLIYLFTCPTLHVMHWLLTSWASSATDAIAWVNRSGIRTRNWCTINLVAVNWRNKQWWCSLTLHIGCYSTFINKGEMHTVYYTCLRLSASMP